MVVKLKLILYAFSSSRMALTFWLDPKTKEKTQGDIKNKSIIIVISKCGRVIFEQVLSFPVLLRYSCNSTPIFHDAKCLN